MVPLFERGPQPLVAHDDRVNHAIGIEGELVLAEHTQLPRPHDGAFLRLHLAGQNLHESGFAGAVRPRQAIALPRRECRRDLIEQNFSAVAHRNVTY